MTSHASFRMEATTMAQQLNETRTACLENIPDDVLVDTLLPYLPVSALESLSLTNHHLHSVATSEALWREKIKADFHFGGEDLELSKVPGGWSQRLWHGLRRPKVYVWGSSGNSRLGLERGDPRLHASSMRGVDFPAEITSTFQVPDSTLHRPIKQSSSQETNANDLNFTRVGVVDLQAGGWSFTARDYEGGVWVLGQLDGLALNFRSPAWRNKHTMCSRPARLPLPCRAESMSAGRRHLLILDADNLIWEMRSWGLAYFHTAPALTSPENAGSASRPPHILQVSSGWSHSSCLTSRGTVYVWFPFTNEYEATLTGEEGLAGPLTQHSTEAEPSEGHIQIKYGQVGSDVIFELPILPDRPVLAEEDDGDACDPDHDALWVEWASLRNETALDDAKRVVKIASGGSFVLALRASGEVWVAALREGQAPMAWEYLPCFSRPGMTHITAQFQTITVYSSISVLIGKCDIPDQPEPGFARAIKPQVIPELQNADIIRVACGDYHNAALNSSGEMFTWGGSSQGALGLDRGDQSVVKPTQVTFGKGDEGSSKAKKPFVFAITAGGWHTGALVLDGPSIPQDEAEPSAKVATPPGPSPPGAFPHHPLHISASAGAGLGAPYFRVGFAGRGGFPRGPAQQ